ncbi:putative serine/threonine-protein kinase [Magnolia sinica]|uniref:putative serine/threonine-protein kinase n=1 Tax=Magnolia sinica TaxID=86752 RepID=UPI0026582258|nr:putative serine/threonine-protein kinase [Magnolia sinica]
MKFSSIYFRCFSSTSKAAAVEPREGGQSFQNVQQFSLKELKTSTHGFRSSNKIGDGGFGSVYKGKLRDGSAVAVKVLSVESTQGEREFLAEIAAMSNVRHKNLVKLRGCCSQGLNRILVYDYMPNNSLSQALLGKERNGAKFSWKVRSRIAFGVAHGLAYLHDEIKPHVVHRDIKASNILLDEDLTAKISDFGLAKLFPDNITHISTRVAGTIGYLAPEYAVRGQLTRKSDVYSFGVLLLEIISGRSVTDFAVELEQYLVTQAWELYNANELLQLVDPMLKGEFPGDEAVRFLKVALLCVQEMPGRRPQMPNVVKMLLDEIDVRDVPISRPGVISDFMDMKIGHKHTSESSKTSTSNTSTSSFSMI